MVASKGSDLAATKTKCLLSKSFPSGYPANYHNSAYLSTYLSAYKLIYFLRIQIVPSTITKANNVMNKVCTKRAKLEISSDIKVLCNI